MARNNPTQDPQERIRWLECVNGYAGTIPAWGLVRVTSVDSSGVLTVDRPNANGQDVYINGPTPIPAGGYGLVSRDWPLFALYESGDGTPAAGDTWGAGASSFKLRKSNAGFAIDGGVVTAQTIVLVHSAAVGANGSVATCASGVTKTLTIQNGIITGIA